MAGRGQQGAGGWHGRGVCRNLIAPLHGRIHQWTDARFQRALASMSNVLPRRVADMREYASLDDLLATVMGKLKTAVRARQSAVFFTSDAGSAKLAHVDGVTRDQALAWAEAWPDGDTLPDCARDDALFPMRLRLLAEGIGTVGWIMLGPRPDGTFYSTDEREALAALVDPVARAIHVFGQRGKRERDVTSRIEQLECELALPRYSARA